MGSKAAPVINGERNKDMRATMNRCDGLGRSPVREKLAVLRLLSSIARYRCHPLEDNVSINCGDNIVYDKVPAFREEV